MAAPYIPPAGTTEIGIADLSWNGRLPPPPTIRADLLDYRTQAFMSVVKDRDPVDAAVIESLWRVRGSGIAVQNTGARFLDVPKLDDNAKTLLSNEARTALERIIRRGDITLLKIVVETGGDWAEVSVHYHNNRSVDKTERVARKRIPEEIDNGTT